MAADSPLKASTPKRGLEVAPGEADNWIERTPQGQLPAYVQHVALALHRERGMPKSQAIGMAIGVIKRWARGGGNVDAGTRAAAAKAVAEWEALKAASSVKKAGPLGILSTGGRLLSTVAKARMGNTGVMIALYPAPMFAHDVALKGGEDPEEIHLTLTFHGKVAPNTQEKLFPVVSAWARSTPPMSGEIAGYGLFTAGSKPVTYLSPDLPDLPLARAKLVAALSRAGMPPRMDHGYTPHMTLAYEDRSAEVRHHGGEVLVFDTVCLVVADVRTTFPLAGSDFD